MLTHLGVTLCNTFMLLVGLNLVPLLPCVLSNCCKYCKVEVEESTLDSSRCPAVFLCRPLPGDGVRSLDAHIAEPQEAETCSMFCNNCIKGFPITCLQVVWDTFLQLLQM